MCKGADGAGKNANRQHDDRQPRESPAAPILLNGYPLRLDRLGDAFCPAFLAAPFNLGSCGVVIRFRPAGFPAAGIIAYHAVNKA